MREDPSQEKEFQSVAAWDTQKYRDEIFMPAEGDPNGRRMQQFSFRSNSLSGNERNRLFLNSAGNFADVTLVSGADDIADGRSFAVVDFDQDGWQDIALMSLNNPKFKLYKNQMQDLYPGNRSLRFRLRGSADSAQGQVGKTNRDGIGAKVYVKYRSGKTMIVQKQCGEGFATQNSGILSVGVPAGDEVVSLVVKWPSGKMSTIDSPDGQVITLIEELN
ncbi:MAG: CRTAC1 family protein [Mariniblastus sp.]|nr:CRTAC1 family protein [Mariniblastus sp.]MDG2182110.1 CRTAC1 family protein [Mariniblastus sp.]